MKFTLKKEAKSVEKFTIFKLCHEEESLTDVDSTRISKEILEDYISKLTNPDFIALIEPFKFNNEPFSDHSYYFTDIFDCWRDNCRQYEEAEEDFCKMLGEMVCSDDSLFDTFQKDASEHFLDIYKEHLQDEDIDGFENDDVPLENLEACTYLPKRIKEHKELFKVIDNTVIF